MGGVERGIQRLPSNPLTRKNLNTRVPAWLRRSGGVARLAGKRSRTESIVAFRGSVPGKSFPSVTDRGFEMANYHETPARSTTLLLYFYRSLRNSSFVSPKPVRLHGRLFSSYIFLSSRLTGRIPIILRNQLDFLLSCQPRHSISVNESTTLPILNGAWRNSNGEIEPPISTHWKKDALIAQVTKQTGPL